MCIMHIDKELVLEEAQEEAELSEEELSDASRDPIAPEAAKA